MLVKFNYKIILQLILTLIILAVIYYTYSFYIDSDETKVRSDSTPQLLINQDEEPNIEEESFIKKIEYNSNDLNGNNYFIQAETADMSTITSNVILMNSVSAIITLQDSTKVKIFSKSANYNLINFNTEFSQDIKVSYNDNEIFTENLDFNFEDGKIYAYNNLIINNNLNNTKLEADRVEIDLITKNTKILSKNNSKKISIIKEN
ncbi:hypothetical protein ABXT47_00465 [Candidatus Pelagibacter sp. Uisw_099_02]|uniref:hypothetical protein n=1 Tax=Candidatus Pelagibacter sp. Uisw_099_02 TaxID=3230981 RepID=UPI0039E9CC0F|tara:strand:+ start:1165 stop:1779 length:615 start_codon:yes stop_codon:yes gene_type:complete